MVSRDEMGPPERIVEDSITEPASEVDVDCCRIGSVVAGLRVKDDAIFDVTMGVTETVGN